MDYKKEIKKLFKGAKCITQKSDFGPEYYEIIIIEKGYQGGSLLSSGNTPVEAWENALPRAKKIKERLSKNEL